LFTFAQFIFVLNMFGFYGKKIPMIYLFWCVQIKQRDEIFIMIVSNFFFNIYLNWRIDHNNTVYLRCHFWIEFNITYVLKFLEITAEKLDYNGIYFSITVFIINYWFLTTLRFSKLNVLFEYKQLQVYFDNLMTIENKCKQ
jgi:hypothetical protein